ncbi:MAG: VOC family protein [Actinomycetota bacterium]|nr:VOC family protein [Actinomycetota bacterium]
MTPPARLRTVVVDCPDPLALAEFYRSLIGGVIERDDEEPEWVVLESEPGRRFGFQQADDYAPPTWPTAERPQQFHLDLTIDDIDSAEPEVLALGARRHEVQPGEADGDNFRVYLDPAGHTFCLCWD